MVPQLLIVLGAVLALAGLGGIAAGAPSWAMGLGLGSTLIQSGTISFVGGLLLLGMAFVLQALYDLLRRIDRIGFPAGPRALESASPPAYQPVTPANAGSFVSAERPLSPERSFASASEPPIPVQAPKLARREGPALAGPLKGETQRERAIAAGPSLSSTASRPRTPEPSIITERNPAGVAVMRSGIIGGMAYTLYADGSIEAELPIGTVRFASLTELQEHVNRTGTEADSEFTGRPQ